LVAVAKAWVLVMVPMIIPFPVLVAVIVIVFAPVSIFPCVMATFTAATLLASVRTLADPLFTVRLLNVVAPVSEVSVLPTN